MPGTVTKQGNIIHTLAVVQALFTWGAQIGFRPCACVVGVCDVCGELCTLCISPGIQTPNDQLHTRCYIYKFPTLLCKLTFAEFLLRLKY